MKREIKYTVVIISVLMFIALMSITIFYSTAHSATRTRPELVAAWEMNEHRNATVLRDSSLHGYRGHIGRHVVPRGSYHHFPAVPKTAYAPGHIDRVRDYPALDFGNIPFAFSVRFRWPNDRHDMNLVQKGQGSPAGGIFKMKTSVPSQGQPKGGIKCLFRGSTGDSQVMSWSNGGRRLNDGKWHKVTCRRTPRGTVMAIDGVLVDRNPNDPGIISNDWPLAIGGNTYCEAAGLLCNYFHGDIGYVRLWKG